MIEFEKVSKRYQTLRVLSDLSFTIGRGEVVGILGPSGSGKTTILRLIAELAQPDSGQVRVKAERLGYVFQEPRLLPWRTVIDNVRIPLRAQQRSRPEVEVRSRLWIDKVGLTGFERYYPAALSGGMQQRVSLARAFALEPDLLILDEPFSSLDQARTADLLSSLQQMIAEINLTAVYVTHDLTELLRIADRIFTLDAKRQLRELDLSDRRQLLLDYVSELLKVNPQAKIGSHGP
ncbi:MAG: ATP-binding cassette domain-containing protein [Chloroflexota bacterium]